MKINNETRVGLMICSVAAILVILTIKAGDFTLSKKGYIMKVQFTRIDGVQENSPVMLNGFEVGNVEEIHIIEGEHGTKMELIVWIEEGIHIREGTKAYVKNMGFLGEKYVGLTSSESTGTYLDEGSIIPGQEPTDLDSLLADGKEIAGNIKEISINLNERLKKNEEASAVYTVKSPAICSLHKSSMRAKSSSLSGLLCEKSNRVFSGSTSDPFC